MHGFGGFKVAKPSPGMNENRRYRQAEYMSPSAGRQFAMDGTRWMHDLEYSSRPN